MNKTSSKERTEKRKWTQKTNNVHSKAKNGKRKLKSAINSIKQTIRALDTDFIAN